MIYKLNGAHWVKTETLSSGKNNIYAFKFVKNEGPVYVIWWEFFNEPGSKLKTFTLKNVGTVEIRISPAIPNFRDGTEISNEDDAATSEVRKIESGKITLQTNSEPLFVELK